MKYDWSVLFGLKVDYKHKQHQKPDPDTCWPSCVLRHHECIKSARKATETHNQPVWSNAATYEMFVFAEIQ